MRTSKPFKLPMTATVTVHRDGTSVIAHSLDFDIVCVSDQEERAVENLRLAVKSYIEYGLAKGWRDYILFSAPDECWDTIAPDTPVALMPPIEVNHARMIVVRAETAPTHGHRAVAC